MRLSLLAALVAVALLSACNWTHWSARQELREEGYTRIAFGEDPGEPDHHVFTARRGDAHCSGIVILEERDGRREARIESHCSDLGGAAAPH